MASAFSSDVFQDSGSGRGPTALSSAEEDAGGAGGAEAALGFRVAMATLYLLVCVAGLGGNGLVMAATLKLDRLRSPATVFIFNLALADGLFMLGLPFITAQNLLHRWPFGQVACKLVMALDGVNQFTSAFCLTAMSVERCLALGRGPGGRGAAGRARGVAAGLWLLSLGPVLPVALHFSADSGLCTLDPSSSDSEAWWAVFLACTFVLGFVLPLAGTVAAYAALLLALREGRRRCRGVAGQSPGAEAQRRERQVTRMVLGVVLAFAVCWLPFYVLNFCALARRDPAEGPGFSRAFQGAVVLSYAWSCANPVLYACLSHTFRSHFRTLLRCPKAQRHDDAVTEGYDLRDTDGQSEV